MFFVVLVCAIKKKIKMMKADDDRMMKEVNMPHPRLFFFVCWKTLFIIFNNEKRLTKLPPSRHHSKPNAEKLRQNDKAHA